MIFSAQALVKKLTQKYGLIIVLLSVVMFQLGNTQNRVNAASPNLMPNPSVESVNPARKTEPLYWHKDTWGSNTSTFTYKKVGHTGSRSVYINTTSYTNGDAKWLSDPVTVTPGETYTYSTYFKSNVRTELLARFTATDGSVSYKWLSGAGKSTSWKKLETQVNIPARTESITLLHILGGVGYLQTDDFSLTHNQPVIALPGQNIVANSSMEATADSVSPLRWQSNTAKVNDAVFSYPQVGHTGSRSGRVVIQNYTSGDAHWSADPQPVTGGKTYEFSNWYQSDVGTEVYAHIVLTDGTEVWKYIGSPLKSTGWNKFYTQFVMPANAVSADIYQTLFSVGYLQTDDYSLNEYQPSGFNRGLVSITFDDSIRSTYANGLPLLTQYGYKSTFYCLGGYLSDPYYMTPEMITELGRSGHEIGSHGMLHTSLVQSSPSQLMSELTTSRDALTNITGFMPTDFASPFGEYNAESLAAIQQYYSSHRSVNTGFNSRENFERYAIKVQNVTSATTTLELSTWVTQANQQRTWLVLVYHAVDPSTANDPDYNTTPTELGSHLEVIRNSGITVSTVNQALAEITPQL